MNLNLTPPDLTAYFAAAPVFRTRLAALFAGIGDLEARITGLLSTLDAGRRYVAAPGPSSGLDHMFTTLRAHRPGGFIPQHFDDEHEARDSYRLIAPSLVSDVFSFVLAFSQAEAGGALEVFNLRHRGRRFRMVDGRRRSASQRRGRGKRAVSARTRRNDHLQFGTVPASGDSGDRPGDPLDGMQLHGGKPRRRRVVLGMTSPWQ